MEINEHYHEEVLRLSIAGDLDASSAIEMDEAIKKAFENERFRIVVDCKRLDYISSAGLGVFISYIEDFQKNQGAFVFCNMKKQVYSIFELLGLHNIFSIVKDENDAKLAFK
ncbi:MAG: STAS domain-containing protein [Chitinophagales bacterium]